MEWNKRKKYNPNGPGYPEAGYWYVLQSEAEERIEELQAEVARLEAGRQNQLILIARAQAAEKEIERLRSADVVPREHMDAVVGRLEAKLKSTDEPHKPLCPKCGKDLTGCNFIGCYGLAEKEGAL